MLGGGARLTGLDSLPPRVKLTRMGGMVSREGGELSMGQDKLGHRDRLFSDKNRYLVCEKRVSIGLVVCMRELSRLKRVYRARNVRESSINYGPLIGLNLVK